MIKYKKEWHATKSLTFKGAQGSIPTNRFRQPMWPGGAISEIELSYGLAGVDRLAESIPWN
jgi:hypothetical protein